jgi:hypothetical protein
MSAVCVRIAGNHGQRLVAANLLNGRKIDPGLDEMSYRCVPEGVSHDYVRI